MSGWARLPDVVCDETGTAQRIDEPIDGLQPLAEPWIFADEFDLARLSRAHVSSPKRASATRNCVHVNRMEHPMPLAGLLRLIVYER